MESTQAEHEVWKRKGVRRDEVAGYFGAKAWEEGRGGTCHHSMLDFVPFVFHISFFFPKNVLTFVIL